MIGIATNVWIRRLRLALAALATLTCLAIRPPATGAATCQVTSAADSGPGTLRAAVDDATCDAVTFRSGLGTITIGAAIIIGRPLTIDGPGQVIQRDPSLASDPAGRVLAITGGTVVLSGLTIQGGRTHTVGGAGLLIIGGDVTLRGVTVRNNFTHSAGGGGISVTNATLRLIDTLVENNESYHGGITPGWGGGGLHITADGGSARVTIARSRFLGNRAPFNRGGGIELFDPFPLDDRTLALTVTDSQIGSLAAPNTAAGGGGLDVADGEVTLTNVLIAGNTAQTGGGIVVGARTTLKSTVIRDNTADWYGGGIAAGSNNADGATMTDVTVDRNRAVNGDGGGLFNQGNATIANATFSGNTAGRNGGGIASANTSLTLTNATLSGNASNGSGGGLYSDLIVANLRFVTVTGNVADGNGDGGGTGGGLRTNSGAIAILSSIVAGNRRGAATPDDCSGAVNSQGTNLVGDATGCPSNGGTDLTLAGPLAAALDPALADNGGPTRTHALPADSPARDHGDAATCPAPIAADQRGVARSDGRCDIGAYEFARFPLTVAVVGDGTVGRGPAGDGDGPFTYTAGTAVALTPQPGAGQAFVGWAVDGVYRGWASPLRLTVDAAHTVQATFAPLAAFPDVGGARADRGAIVALASRGTIQGYRDGRYGPDDGVQRAQMAALIARATSSGPGTPSGGTLAPPACLAAGTWDCEDWGNGFSDRNGLDANLWRNIGALQHYQVAFGYDGAACAARGVASPCYGPTAPVSYVETIVFITRAMVAKGYWAMQAAAPQPYAGVPGVFDQTVATYQFYAAGAGGVSAPPANWNAGATRGWFARALWQALNTYWGTDGPLPDGRPAGGNVP